MESSGKAFWHGRLLSRAFPAVRIFRYRRFAEACCVAFWILPGSTSVGLLSFS
jgi:hypothetical protein